MSEGTENVAKELVVGYVATDKKTDNGHVIYHLRTGVKGRPARFLKSKGEYVPYVTPKPVALQKAAKA